MLPTLAAADCCVFSLLIASSGGGAFSSIRFLGMQQGQQQRLPHSVEKMTMRTIKMTPTMPPTTPPMMAFIEDEDEELGVACVCGLDDVTTVTADTPV